MQLICYAGRVKQVSTSTQEASKYYMAMYVPWKLPYLRYVLDAHVAASVVRDKRDC